jgi:hypothetical protein
MEVIRHPDHTYTIDGVKVPGVTTVIRSAGYMNPGRYTAEARNRGTYVHKVCELWDKGTLVLAKVEEWALPYLFAWRLFCQDTGFKSEEIEYVVGHPTLMYAGTLDRLGDCGGENTLVDIKTGSAEAWHAVQSKAYAEPVSSLCPRLAVYLSDNGKYKVEEHKGFDDWPAFRAALDTWKWKERHGLNRRDDD